MLALAYPDRIAQRRAGSAARYLLRNGSGAQLPAHDALASSPYLAIADLDGAPPEYRIARAAPLTVEEVREVFAADITSTEIVEWDDDARAVRAWKREQLDALVLSERRITDPDPDLVRDAILAMLERVGIAAWPWSESANALRARLAFIAHHDQSWPSMSDEVLLSTLEEWCGTLLRGARTWTALERLNWHDALLDRLTWQQRSQLDQLAPTHVEVPTGSRITVDYTDPDAPMLAARLQELFGWPDAPRLLQGRVPLTIQLLSPAYRPVQVTRDLPGFWKNSYFDVRKEMRGRYPRHSWPDDPLTAPPTRRAKPRGT
jgi:ATP-dependent helicase HrpB